MSEQLLLCSYLCIIRIDPIKSLVSLYFLVILPPLSIWPSVVILYFFLAQCLLWFRKWCLQYISQRESRTSRRVSVSVFGNVELAGAGCYLLYSCFINFPGAGLGFLSFFYSPFGVLSLDLEHSSAMFACHIPNRLGTAMQQIQQSLVIGFDPNHGGEKETAL